MGTSYDLRCIDCASNAQLAAPWDPVRFGSVQAVFAAVPALSTLAIALPLPHRVEVNVDGVGVSLPWLALHHGRRCGREADAWLTVDRLDRR
jgi:hypothetical protein